MNLILIHYSDINTKAALVKVLRGLNCSNGEFQRLYFLGAAFMFVLLLPFSVHIVKAFKHRDCLAISPPTNGSFLKIHPNLNGGIRWRQLVSVVGSRQEVCEESERSFGATFFSTSEVRRWFLLTLLCFRREPFRSSTIIRGIPAFV